MVNLKKFPKHYRKIAKHLLDGKPIVGQKAKKRADTLVTFLPELKGNTEVRS